MLKYCTHFRKWAAYVVWFVKVCLWDAEAQDAYSEGGSPHKSIVSDDADELYGDSIDEDTQSVRAPVDTAPTPSTSGELHGACYEVYCCDPSNLSEVIFCFFASEVQQSPLCFSASLVLFFAFQRSWWDDGAQHV